jgi:Na+/H+ antiporter NhaD/arsenite permease-like protein
MITFKYLVLGLTYLGLGLGYFPGLRMNRAVIAIVGSASAVALGILNLNTAWEAIDLGTIVFLFGMMVVNSALGSSGFFNSPAHKISQPPPISSHNFLLS